MTEDAVSEPTTMADATRRTTTTTDATRRPTTTTDATRRTATTTDATRRTTTMSDATHVRSSASSSTAHSLSRQSRRLSGFFTNLMHRRDHHQSLAPHPEDTPAHSRPQSPALGRPVTPPPPLPPPTLQELGLSLSLVTPTLSPAHFSAPPASGAFLFPHFLLLCHPQGLDVLPLVSPPAPQPYALVRRVNFKSVVVMEQRGVLVAIAGRRDGVRVYALEEIKKAIDWRIEVEIRRERERNRSRRESVKKIVINSLDNDAQKLLKSSLAADYKTSPTLIPRSPTHRAPKKSRAPPVQLPPPLIHGPNDQPPPYSSPCDLTHPPRLHPSSPSLHSQSPSPSVTNLLAPAPRNDHPDIKTDWTEPSDDEAIDIVAAEASGSQALDERTSATLSANPQTTPPAQITPRPRRTRPSNLDLSFTHSAAPPAPSEPSPAPTLLTLRQALSSSPPTRRTIHTTDIQEPYTPFGDDDDADDDDGVSLTQMLMESRLPHLPPAGTRQPQEPILLSTNPTTEPEPESPRTSEGQDFTTARRHRRWSTLLGGSPLDIAQSTMPTSAPATAPLPRPLPRLTRSQSVRSSHSQSSNDHPTNETPALPELGQVVPSSRSLRFLPRILSNTFISKKSRDGTALSASALDDSNRKPPYTPMAPQAPKLEYVKLPGTKGALMIKAVETAKKSFLAILCGENGEKVELFAGTYRTALGLSRTFILPDSPRSLELQLQGDDLVEVFLVFSQNVFGLEPATVRVREVRIGRAERRAARRRAREVRAGENASNDSEAATGEEDTNVNVSIGVSVAVGSAVVATGDGVDTLIPSEHPDAHQDTVTAPDTTMNSTIAQSEELVAVATAQMGPYTTFQQLNFAPNFPLASIADEYIIPPTYPSFLEYRAEHEREHGSRTDLTQIQFTPPGLPVPVPRAPSRWYYRDPREVVHGPWKASLMQAWYKDGLLPLNLPVRREEDENFILLKDLRLQSVDPVYPFRSPPPSATTAPAEPTTIDTERPLLKPISLLAQPRHFGPPALFFSSRGGHSTAIVDARGRSVLKGRFLWSSDEHDNDSKTTLVGRMGDIKRLEALDVDDRSVLVAMRQGGLEAVDLSDALLRPADESRTVLPQFTPPVSNINRRAPFVWKIGMPVSSSPTTATVLSQGKGSSSQLSNKKSTTGPTKSPPDPLFDVDLDSHDEVLFLGRKDDALYFCERNAGSFRVLRLCPITT